MLRTMLLAAMLAAPAAPLPAQSVCRPNALGAYACLGPSVPPPMPRPVFVKRKRGLDQVWPPEAAGSAAPEFIPAWRRTGLGSILLERSECGSGLPCRTDSLGNLICP